MATFATDTTIGSTATDAAFVANTRIWAGGDASFDATEIFDIANGFTATAVDATIACTFLGTDSGLATTPAVGTIDLTNTTVYANNSAERSSANNWDFDNVTYVDNSLTRTINIGRFAGALGTLTSYQIDGFNLYGNVDTTDSTLGFLVFFPDFRRLTAGSTLNNISLWNGETGADILGSVFTYSYSIFSGLRSGPIGFRPFYDTSNTNTSTRALFRCAFGPDNQLNQHGHLLSYDFRAIEGLAGQWRFACDNAGRTTIVNPLVGTLTSGRLAWACGQNSLNSAFRSYIGHTPSIEGDAIFANAGTLPMVTFPETWTANVLPTVVTTNILTQVEGSTSTVVNGLGFETESGALGDGGSNGANYLATTANVANIAYTYPTAQNYRVYSWQQGDWGKLVPITPTETGATDAQVETDRASGLYPFCTPTGFATTRNINGPLDPLELNAGLTPAQANAQRNLVVGSIVARNTNEIGMHSKAVSYNAAQVAGSHTALVPLIHTLTGTTLDFGSQNLSIGAHSTIQPNLNSVTGTAFDIRALDITVGVDSAGLPVADVVSTDGSILLTDFGTGTATNKATLQAGSTTAGNVTVIHTTDATIRNINMSGGGTFLATGETLDNCNLDFGLIQGDNTTHSNCTIEVGSGYTDIEGDTNTNVTYVGTFNAVIGGSNNVSRTLEQVFGTGFDTSGATITLLADTGVTGLSVAATNAELTAANVTLGTGIAQVAPPLSRTFTFAKAGKYVLGRVRGGTYTAIPPFTFEVPVQTISTRVITTGTDGWLAGDIIRMRFLPTNGTSDNTALYVPATIDTPLTDGTTVIDQTPVVTEILTLVDISDTLVSGATITNTTITGTNIPFVVTTTGDLELPQTKGLYFRLFQHAGTLLHMGTNNFDAADMFSIGALGITHNEVNSSIAKPTIADQRAITGVSSVGTNALIASGDSAATNTYVIATTGGTRDFIVNRVPEGITEGQVEAALGRRISQAQLGTIANQEKIAKDIQISSAGIGAASDGTVPDQSI